MAERRMFSKKIIDSDAFLEMPTSAQLLYFHLSMHADDDGFVNNSKSIMRTCGCESDDMTQLILKKFLISFDSGVVVIKHWRVNNYIRNDRYQETNYEDEKSALKLENNGSYSLMDTGMDTVGIPNDYQTDTQYRLGKDRLGKVSIDNNMSAEPTNQPEKQKHKHGYYKNVLLTDDEIKKMQDEFPNDYTERIERLSEYIASTGKKYKSHIATIRSWAKRESREKGNPTYRVSPSKFNNFEPREKDYDAMKDKARKRAKKMAENL